MNETNYHNLETLNIACISADISASPLCKSIHGIINASGLAMCYDTMMRSLLEEHASLQRKTNEISFTFCDASHCDRQFILPFLLIQRRL